MQTENRVLKAALVSPGSFTLPFGRSSSVEEVIVQLSRELAPHADITVYGRRPLGYQAQEVTGGVRFIRPYRGKAGLRYIEAVCRHMKKENYDVIQVDNRPRYVRTVKRHFPNIPVWLSLHSLTFVSEKRIKKQTLHACLRHASRIVVNSEYLKQMMDSRFPDLADRIIVNHPGVNDAQFISRWEPETAEKRQRMAERLGVMGKTVIVFAGRLLPMKGVHHIISAVRRVVKVHPSVHLFVIGGSTYGSKRRTAYVQLLRRLAKPIRKHVTFVPYVSHEKIPEWFRLADVAAVPSFGREAFGLVNIEAMASGAAVLATNGGGMTEIVEDGVTGYLVDEKSRRQQLAERILELTANPELCMRMGMAGRARVEERFLWRHCANRWLSFAIETNEEKEEVSV